MRSNGVSRRLKLGTSSAIVAAALISLSPHGALAQDQRTSWSGVYASAEAARGQAVFAAKCAACHGATLAGGGAAPALAGRNFLFTWDGQSASDLYARIYTTMPADNPGSLDPATARDLIAYIFSVNGFPAGQSELPKDEAGLRAVTIKAKSGS